MVTKLKNEICIMSEKSIFSPVLNCLSDKEWLQIIKVFKYDFNRYYNEGFRQFHLSNTLPTKYGGLSGPSLKPYTQRNIQYIKKFYPNCIIIAGGGIQSMKDIEEYKKAGANYFSISSIFFHPFKTLSFFSDIYF